MIDGEGWAFYRVVVSAMTEAGMEPMPTLRFAGYVEVAIREIGPACPWWLVFNEPSVSVLMETKMRSYELIKAANNDAMVSSNEATGNLPLPVRAGAGHVRGQRLFTSTSSRPNLTTPTSLLKAWPR